MELQKGTSLQKGKYTIEKKLGSGSFGITYLATMKVKVAESLGAIESSIPVAIKEFFMSDLNSRSADGSLVEGSQNTLVSNYRRKFRTEAENLGRMEHPNIVNVLEVWDENNTTYYSMEYIDGVSLDDYIRQYGPLPEAKAIDLFSQLADAVQYMHSKRMLHLDIKPKNAMLNKAEKLLLIDFGLSKQYDANGDPESSTRVGGGTPGYAPVEQADFHDGKDFPVTMDIYALGATLFKMLTGQTPPAVSEIVSEGFPVQLLEKNGVSQITTGVIKKAMSLSKHDRYQSVKEMAGCLQEENVATATPNTETFEDTILDSPKQTGKKHKKKDKTTEMVNATTSIPSVPWWKSKWTFSVVGLVAAIIIFFIINDSGSNDNLYWWIDDNLISTVYLQYADLISFVIIAVFLILQKTYKRGTKSLKKCKWLIWICLAIIILNVIFDLLVLINDSYIIGVNWRDDGGASVGIPIYHGRFW